MEGEPVITSKLMSQAKRKSKVGCLQEMRVSEVLLKPRRMKRRTVEEQRKEDIQRNKQDK